MVYGTQNVPYCNHLQLTEIEDHYGPKPSFCIILNEDAQQGVGFFLLALQQQQLFLVPWL